MRKTWLYVVLLTAALLPALPAQDDFEIQIYEWETVPKGMWNLETHLNYIGKGTKEFEGTVAPTNNQMHLTYELTHGITQNFELAGYLVLARRPGQAFLDYAGARIRPRYSLPDRWRLPVKISISGEVAFPRRAYEEHTTTVELRPIIERSFGKLQVDLNPTVARALRGPGEKHWEFEPALRLAYLLTKRFEPSIEYYGGLGPLTGFHELRDQAHLLYPGWDVKVSENLVWNFGIGVAMTPAGNQLTYKMRLGWLFGKKGA